MKNQRVAALREVQKEAPLVAVQIKEVHFKMKIQEIKIKEREGLFRFNLINKNFFPTSPTRLTQQPVINLIKIVFYINNLSINERSETN